MNVIFEVEDNAFDIECGDVVVINGVAFLIACFEGKYTTKKISDGSVRATGTYSSLVGLVKSFNRLNWTHYSKNEYDFKLVPKQKESSTDKVFDI